MSLENFNEQLLFSVCLLNCCILSLSTLNRSFIQIKRCLYTREEWVLHIWNCLGNFSIQAETAILGRIVIHAVWYSSQKPCTTQGNFLIFIRIFIANVAYQLVWWFLKIPIAVFTIFLGCQYSYEKIIMKLLLLFF